MARRRSHLTAHALGNNVAVEYVLEPATVREGSRQASHRGNPGSHLEPLRAAVAPRGVPGEASPLVGWPRSTRPGPFPSSVPAELVQAVVVDAEVVRHLVHDCHLDLVHHVVVRVADPQDRTGGTAGSCRAGRRRTSRRARSTGFPRRGPAVRVSPPAPRPPPGRQHCRSSGTDPTGWYPALPRPVPRTPRS